MSASREPQSEGGDPTVAVVASLIAILAIILLVAIAAQGVVFALVIAVVGAFAGLPVSFMLIARVTRRRGPYDAESDREEPEHSSRDRASSCAGHTESARQSSTARSRLRP